MKALFISNQTRNIPVNHQRIGVFLQQNISKYYYVYFRFFFTHFSLSLSIFILFSYNQI